MRTFGRYSVASFLSAVVTISSVGLVLGLAFAVVLAFTSTAMDFHGAQLGIPVAMIVDSARLHVSAPSLGVAGASLDDVTGTLKFAPGSRASLAVPFLTVIVMLVIGIWVLHQLRALFRALRDGNVFAPANARRVHRVG